MAIREIRVVPDPVLRTPCDPIKEITPAVRHLVQDLLDTVDDPGRAGLSAPGLWYKPRRADYARVRGIDLDGNPVVLEGHDIMGRMLQHETDHLDGHVYLDRLEKEERREAMRYMRNHRQ